ncbi:MAG: hypothetical protein R2799_05055 [Crocinitomicaceae bacterium]
MEEFIKKMSDSNDKDYGKFPQEQRTALINEFTESNNELVNVRVGIFRADTGRSLIFFLLAAGLLYIFIFRNVRNEILIIGGIGLLITVDLFTVDKRYLDNEKERKGICGTWTKKIILQYPFYPEPGEQFILQEEVKRNPDLQQALQAEDAKVNEFAKENDLKGQEVDNIDL